MYYSKAERGGSLSQFISKEMDATVTSFTIPEVSERVSSVESAPSAPDLALPLSPDILSPLIWVTAFFVPF